LLPPDALTPATRTTAFTDIPRYFKMLATVPANMDERKHRASAIIQA
jgi:hypothetical protein